MATVKPKPPAPPKPKTPDKKIPKSQRNLDARDKEPNLTENEEKETGIPEEYQDKKEGGEDEEKKEARQGGAEEDNDYDDEEESIEVVGGGLLNLFTVWGLLFFMIFAMIDFVEVLLLFVLLDDFWILDIIGLIFYIVWQAIYKNFYGGSGQMAAGEGAKGRLKAKTAKGLSKIFTGKWSKFLVPITGEVIPYLGGILPTWTISFIVQIMNS